MTLSIGLRKGPRRVRFLVSEVPLYSRPQCTTSSELPYRFSAKRLQLWCEGCLPRGEAHNLALTFLYVPYSLDSGLTRPPLKNSRESTARHSSQSLPRTSPAPYPPPHRPSTTRGRTSPSRTPQPPRPIGFSSTLPLHLLLYSCYRSYKVFES